jgi:CRISPR/Cas system-associated exonuclease Cas4 (RecB family)
MNLYAMATEKLSGKLSEKTTLYYLAKDKLVENEILSSKVDEVKGLIKNNVKLILDEQFQAKPEYKSCRYRSFWDICDEKGIQNE